MFENYSHILPVDYNHIKIIIIIISLVSLKISY